MDSHPGSIVTARPNGTHRRVLAEGARPGWSTSGRQIVFDEHPGGITFVSVMNADGTGVHRLTEHRVNSYDPSWSPADHRTAFVSEVHGERGVTLAYTPCADWHFDCPGDEEVRVLKVNKR